MRPTWPQEERCRSLRRDTRCPLRRAKPCPRGPSGRLVGYKSNTSLGGRTPAHCLRFAHPAKADRRGRTRTNSFTQVFLNFFSGAPPTSILKFFRDDKTSLLPNSHSGTKLAARKNADKPKRAKLEKQFKNRHFEYLFSFWRIYNFLSVTSRWAFKSYYAFLKLQLATTFGGEVKTSFSIFVFTHDLNDFKTLDLFWFPKIDIARRFLCCGGATVLWASPAGGTSKVIVFSPSFGWLRTLVKS